MSRYEQLFQQPLQTRLDNLTQTPALLSTQAGKKRDENAALHSHLHGGAASSFLQAVHGDVSPKKSFSCLLLLPGHTASPALGYLA